MEGTLDAVGGSGESARGTTEIGLAYKCRRKRRERVASEGNEQGESMYECLSEGYKEEEEE